MICRSKGLCMAGLGVAVAAIVMSGLAPQTATPAKAAAPDQAKIAKTLVVDCGGFQATDIVLIEGGPRDIELLEYLAVEVRKLGGEPMITIGSDRLNRLMFTDVPAKFDSQAPELGLKLADTIDGIISIDFSERPDLLSDIDPQRLITREKTGQAVAKKMQERGVVQVNLGNDLYPTKARAESFGITQEQLTKIFWDGVNTDYKALQATGASLQKSLSAGKTVHITAPNGTDLTVQITQRPVFVSDGVVSYDDRTSGGPATQVWLPAGEVYVTPVPGTAKGTFVADHFNFEGKAVEGFTMKFENGNLTSMTAKGDISALKKRYDAAPAGKEQFAAIDIGINPSVVMPANSRLLSWVPAGTISVGFGGNTWAGGDNQTPFDVFAHLPNGTVTIDGTKIIENGKLLVK